MAHDDLLCGAVLIGSRLLRIAELLLRTKLSGKTLSNRVRFLDSRPLPSDQIAHWLLEEADKRNIQLGHELCNRIVAAAVRGKPRKKYAPYRLNDACIVLAYYAPCDFRAPRQNFMRVLQQFLSAGYPVCVAEAVFPNATALVLPPQVMHKRILATDKNTLFLKENLYNLAAETLPHAKLVFVDADIEFTRRDWLQVTSALLNSHDVVQLFSTAVWRDKDNSTELLTKLCAAACLTDNAAADLRIYHPGFGWAMRRDFFNAVGGWYENHPLGCGDTGFWLALYSRQIPNETATALRERNNLFLETAAFKDYRSRVQKLKPKISYVANNYAMHLWHGKLKNRQYADRSIDYLPALLNGDYPVARGKNGLLEWLFADDAVKCLQYFQKRAEDD